MRLTDDFYEAVKLGDVQSVRIMMKDSLLTDPSFAQFEQMEEASSSLKGLYEEHDGRDFQDKNTWNDNYMNILMVQILNNFSHERIEHLKQVVNYLRPISNSMTESEFLSPNSQNKISYYKKQNAQSQTDYLTYEQKKARDKANGTYLGSKASIVIISCGVIGGVAASVGGCSVVGGAIVGGAIGAAGTIAVSKIKGKRD